MTDKSEEESSLIKKIRTIEEAAHITAILRPIPITEVFTKVQIDEPDDEMINLDEVDK